MWDTFKEYLSVLSGVGTAIGFIATAYQLRSLNRQGRREAHGNITTSEREIWKIALENENIAPNLMKSLWGHTSNSPSEALFTAVLMDQFEHAFLRWNQGLMPLDMWLPYESHIVSVLSTPSVREVWQANKHKYWDQFTSHFDLLLTKQGRKISN
jgi:hypothetical protein